MTASYQPYYTGNTYPAWQLPLQRDGVNDDISAVDPTKFFVWFKPIGNSPEVQGTGTVSALSYSPAIIAYKPSPADVANPFVGFIIVKAFWPPSGTNADEVVYDPIGGIGNTLAVPVPFQITQS